MNFLKTFILLVVLVVGVAYVYKTEHLAGIEEKNAAKEAKRIFDFDTGDVNRIVVAGKEEVEARLENGVWRITRPIESLADANTIKKMLGAAKTRKVMQIIDDAGNLEIFGLKDAEWRVDFYTADGETPHTVWLGNETPSKRGFYARTTKIEKVFSAWKGLKGALANNLYKMRSKRLMDGELAHLGKVEFTHGATRIVLQRKKDATWEMLEPIKTKGDKVEANALFHAILHANTLEFIENEPSAKETGFDFPKTTVRIWLEGNEEPTVMIFGKRNLKGNGIWAKNIKSGTVGLVKPGFFNIYELTVGSLRDKALFSVEGEELKKKIIGVRWDRGGRKMEILRNKAGVWEMTKPRKDALDQIKFLEFVEGLVYAEASKFANEGLLMGASKLFQIEVLLASDTRRVTFYGITGRNDLRFGSGGPFDEPFIVDAKVYETLDKKPLDFIDRHILHIKPGDVRMLSVERGDMKVKAEKNRGEWRISEPQDYFANDRKVASIINFLIALEYERKLEAGPSEDIEPLAVIKMKTEGGRESAELKLLRYNRDKSLLLATLEGDDSLLLIKPDLLNGILPERVEDLVP